MCIITELVTMKALDNITKEEFISIVDDLEKNFHSKQLGFIDSELIYDEKSNLWVMIQHRKSIEQLKVASEKIFKDSRAETFVKSINPKDIKITTMEQVKVWK